jgi:hypothetical protein
MKRSLNVVVAIGMVALSAATLRAQGARENENGGRREVPARDIPSLRRDAPPSTLTPPATTPEMWFYEQERLRYEDPKTAVRRHAEYRFAQQQRRIESRKWFGISNSRPIASPNPWYDTYSPMWVSNTAYPYEWSGVGYPAIIYRGGGFVAPGY